MRKLIVGLLVVITFILDTSLFQALRIYGIKPDVMLILVTSYALLQGGGYGAFTGLACGLFTDLFFGRAIGLNALAYMIVGFVIGKGSDRVFKDSVFTAILFQAIAVVLFHQIYFALNFLIGVKVSYVYGLTHIMLPEMVYNMVVGVLVYRLIYKIDHTELADKVLL